MRTFPKNVSKSSNIASNSTTIKNNQPLSTTALYTGTSIGTKYYSDASLLDGLFNISDEKAMRAIFRDMVANDPTIRSGIELRCALFDIDFSVSGNIDTEISSRIKKILTNAGIYDKLKTLVWNYFVYGEALMYVYVDDKTEDLYISNILNLDNCVKKTPVFGNKTIIEYSHGVLGKKTEILEILKRYLQKIREQNKNFAINYGEQSSYKINNFRDVKNLYETSNLEENDLFLVFKYSIEAELGKSSLINYLATEFFVTNKIDFTSFEFPILINDNPVVLDSHNLIYLNRSFILEGGSTKTDKSNTTNGHYQGLDGNAIVCSGSMLRPLIGLWMLESKYFRNTANIADRRLSPPIWIQCGNKDEPISETETRKVSENWNNIFLDPSNGATFVTNHLVSSIQPIDTIPGAWLWDTTFDSYNAKKLQALGINESWFSGDASYNTYESVATAFGCQIARDRKYLTKKVFTEVLLPLISEKLDLYEYTLPKINIRITPDMIANQNTEEPKKNEDFSDLKINIQNAEENKKNEDFNELKINIIPERDTKIIVKDTNNINYNKIRLRDPIIKIQQEDKNNKKTNIKISLKNLDEVLSNEDKKNIIDKIYIKNPVKDNFYDNEDKMFEEEKEEDPEININIKELKKYDDPNSKSSIKVKNLKSTNRIILSKALPKELIIPSIEWEVSTAQESLDRIKSKIEMLGEHWNISSKYVAFLMGVDVAELEKFECTPKKEDNSEGLDVKMPEDYTEI